VREQAVHELEKIGPAVGPALRAALNRKPTEEVRRRINMLLAKWDAPPKQPPGQKPTTTVPWFKDVSERVGLGPEGIGSGLKGDTLTVCDVDGDGKPDFLYGAGTGLLVMNRTKGFVLAKDSGIAYKPGKVGPVFGDFDNDGHPDLFVPQKGRSLLFRNDGKG